MLLAVQRASLLAHCIVKFIYSPSAISAILDTIETLNERFSVITTSGAAHTILTTSSSVVIQMDDVILVVTRTKLRWVGGSCQRC